MLSFTAGSQVHHHCIKNSAFQGPMPSRACYPMVLSKQCPSPVACLCSSKIHLLNLIFIYIPSILSHLSAKFKKSWIPLLFTIRSLALAQTWIHTYQALNEYLWNKQTYKLMKRKLLLPNSSLLCLLQYRPMNLRDEVLRKGIKLYLEVWLVEKMTD